MAESSFDVVSNVDMQEVKNAIAQAMKEISTRFDLKGSNSNIELQGKEIVITSGDDSKMKAVRDVLVDMKRAGFGDADARHFFGQPPLLSPAMERDYLTPWPADTAEKRYLERFAALSRE